VWQCLTQCESMCVPNYILPTPPRSNPTTGKFFPTKLYTRFPSFCFDFFNIFFLTITLFALSLNIDGCVTSVKKHTTSIVFFLTMDWNNFTRLPPPLFIRLFFKYFFVFKHCACIALSGIPSVFKITVFSHNVWCVCWLSVNRVTSVWHSLTKRRPAPHRLLFGTG